MQFVSLIETVIVFIQEVIKMMKINKLSAFILAGALTCTAPAMVYADQTTDAAVDQAVELLEQSGVDDLLSQQVKKHKKTICYIFIKNEDEKRKNCANTRKVHDLFILCS